MIKYFTTLFLGCYFLAGSMVLPLGDFSLMPDLPDMYHSYCKVTTETPDIIDFIGDYIWSGKDLLGHNKHDAPAAGSLNFQHQACPSLYFSPITYHIYTKPQVCITKPFTRSFLFQISGYQGENLRPPIS